MDSVIELEPIVCPFIVDLPELSGSTLTILKGCKLQPTRTMVPKDSGWKVHKSFVQCPQKGYRDNFKRCPLYVKNRERGKVD